MIRIFVLSFASLVAVATAHAGGPSPVLWAGAVEFSVEHRGTHSTLVFQQDPVSLDVCNYNTFTMNFQAYKVGVTDQNGVTVWQQLNTQVKSVQDSNGQEIGTATPNFTGRVGNNATFSASLASLKPNTVTGFSPNPLPAHINVILDGAIVSSTPVIFSCTH